MAIAVECPNCHTVVRVADELAGRKGACKNCGTIMRIGAPTPASGAAQSSVVMQAPKLLADATPKEMVAELARRGASALLTLLDPVRLALLEGESTKLGDLIDSGAKLGSVAAYLPTDTLDDERLARFLKQLADGAEQRLASKSQRRLAAAQEGVAFTFKGDALGLALADFKQKYARPAGSGLRKLPWCSDDSPGMPIAELWTEAWHSGAGIVHARIDAPNENNSPTIAGIRTDLVLYQFLDGKLYQILVVFGTDSFHVVADALRTKFGAPAQETEHPKQLTWWSTENSIVLTFGRISPRAPSVLRYVHDELAAEAASRQPQQNHDI